MKISREAIQSVIFLGRDFSIFYDGPHSLDEWKRENTSWQYSDGALIAHGPGAIGRDFKLPEMSRLEFDLSWNGSFNLILLFSTPTFDRLDYGNSSYMIYLNPGAVSVQRVQPSAGMTSLGGARPIPNVATKKKVHLEIRADKKEAVLAILADGVLIQKWKDEKGFVGTGSGAVFYAQTETAPIKISNIRASVWDGKFEEDKAAIGKEDLLYLLNHDKISGQLEKFREGKLFFSVHDKLLQIPLARVSQIVFGNRAIKPLAENPWKVRTLFSGGETLSFQLQKWEEKTAAGLASFGQVAFDPKTAREVQFNRPKKNAGKVAAENSDQIESADEPGFTRDFQDALLFRNGDVLSGGLQSIDPPSALRWRRDDALQTIEFRTAAISEIRFRSQPLLPAPTTNGCQIHLRNGDQLEGDLAAVDAKKRIFNTSYAGQLNFPRNQIQWIAPVTIGPRAIFAGPTGLEGWTMGKIAAVPDGGQWEYKNGAFYASRPASIARPLSLPDRASIQFDLAWKGMLKAAIGLYTDSLQPVNLQTKDTEADFGGFYSLQIDNFSALIMRVKKNDPLFNFAPATVPAFSQKNSAHLELRVDKSKRLLALLVDGVLIKQWIDQEKFAGSGQGMRFVHQGLGLLKLNHLRIAPWDGRFEEASPTNSVSDFDAVQLRNGDKITGQLEKISNGNFVMTTPGT
ncbi:MAG: hypothetical protein ACR2H1_10565, partial [Limisphaerales bacterium]